MLLCGVVDGCGWCVVDYFWCVVCVCVVVVFVVYVVCVDDVGCCWLFVVIGVVVGCGGC